MKDGVHCTVCSRHCPQGAITLVPRDPSNPKGAQIPVVDADKCTGCGACEHLCPARPMPGISVNGYVQQRETSPMPQNAAAPQTSPVWAGLRLA